MAGEGGAKELFQLITHRPALLITALVGVGLVIYLLVRNSSTGTQQSSATGTSGVNASTSTPDYSAYQQGYDMGYTQGSYSVPSPAQAATSASSPPDTVSPLPPTQTMTQTVTTPIPTTTINANNPQYTSAYTRPLWNGETSNPGLPIWSAPASDASWSTSGSVPINTPVSVGNPVTGNYYGMQKVYYPVSYMDTSGKNTSGFILSTDLGNIGGK